VELALGEKAKRYRRIAALASEEESIRQTKPALRLSSEKISGDKRENHSGQRSTAD
jgi:hypothetical protein